MKFFLKYIISCFILIFFGLTAKAELVINEIHPAPVSNQPEWIELYNNSIDTNIFSGGYINDAVGMKRLPEFQIPPWNYIILTKDSTAFLSRWFKSDSCQIIQTSLPTFNNDVDMVIIRNSDSLLLDSIFYNMKYGFKGISLERFNPYLPVFDFQNLKSCISPDSSSPGKWNSVSFPKKDISIKLIEQNSDTLKFLISNNSENELQLDAFKLSIDLDNNGFYDENELTSSFYNIAIKKNENYEINYCWDDFHIIMNIAGNIYYKAEIEAKDDDDLTNNSIESIFYKNIVPNSLVINEIMFDVEDSQAEYIELFNLSTSSVVLNDMLLHDAHKSSGYDSIKFSRPNPLLESGQYIAVFWDSSFYLKFPELTGSKNAIYIKSKMNLSFSGDDIVLLSPTNYVIDSVSYKNSWHNSDFANTKGKSLEKINPYLLSNIMNSWTTSLDFKGGTPARENSVFKEQLLVGELIAEPNPFSASGNYKKRHCIIKYEIPFDRALVDIVIYDRSGNLIRTLVSKHDSDRNGIFTWDGLNDAGFKLDIGPYVLMLSAKHQNGKEYINKILIVIAG